MCVYGLHSISAPARPMEESLGKVQAHIKSGVVMDIAAFKVSHSVVTDMDATALRIARARSSSIHRGDG